MNPPTTDADANDDDADTNLDPHRTDEKEQKSMTKYDSIIVSILKRRTADPLPNGSHEHHQWQGEAGDEDDDDIITDIIERRMNIKGKGEGFDTNRDNVLVTRTIKKETFHITIPENIVPGEKFMVFAGGRNMCVRCPKNTKPGEQLQIKLPVLNANEEGSSSEESALPDSAPDTSRQLGYCVVG
jgi:hypothetical protein